MSDLSELNPGSDEAVAAGCTCPSMDNARGRGFMGGAKNEQGNTVFVIDTSCPLHGQEEETNAE